MAEQFSMLGLCGVFHYQEVSRDVVSLAASLSGIVRFGVHWSAAHGINISSLKVHQMFFYSGANEKIICTEAGSSKTKTLIAGSISHRMLTADGRNLVSREARRIKSKGAKRLLALFDHKAAPNFYSFFINWLLTDCELGLIIKGKGDTGWGEFLSDDLNGKVTKAISTGRLSVLPGSVQPADVGASSEIDFCVGMGSTSAIIVCALQGARVIYLDYENSFRSTFSSETGLKKDLSAQVVFTNPEEAKTAILMSGPNKTGEGMTSIPQTVLNEFDPFLDNNTATRIARFIECYLRAFENTLDGNEALDLALDKVRRLSIFQL
jgi:hypothetical protein